MMTSTELLQQNRAWKDRFDLLVFLISQGDFDKNEFLEACGLPRTLWAKAKARGRKCFKYGVTPGVQSRSLPQEPLKVTDKIPDPVKPKPVSSELPTGRQW